MTIMNTQVRLTQKARKEHKQLRRRESVRTYTQGYKFSGCSLLKFQNFHEKYKGHFLRKTLQTHRMFIQLYLLTKFHI